MRPDWINTNHACTNTLVSEWSLRQTYPPDILTINEIIYKIPYIYVSNFSKTSHTWNTSAVITYKAFVRFKNLSESMWNHPINTFMALWNLMVFIIEAIKAKYHVWILWPWCIYSNSLVYKVQLKHSYSPYEPHYNNKSIFRLNRWHNSVMCLKRDGLRYSLEFKSN